MQAQKACATEETIIPKHALQNAYCQLLLAHEWLLSLFLEESEHLSLSLPEHFLSAELPLLR